MQKIYIYSHKICNFLIIIYDLCISISNLVGIEAILLLWNVRERGREGGGGLPYISHKKEFTSHQLTISLWRTSVPREIAKIKNFLT